MNVLTRAGNLLASTIMMALVSGTASAGQTEAISTAGLNMRAGPAAGAHELATVPAGAVLQIRACVRGYFWCEASHAGNRGWVNSKHLKMREDGSSFRVSARRVGVAVVDGTPAGLRVHDAERSAGRSVAPDGAPTRSRADPLLVPDRDMYWPLDNRDLLGGDIPG